MRRLVKEQLHAEAAGTPPPQLQSVIEAHVREALGPVSKELHSRLSVLEQAQQERLAAAQLEGPGAPASKDGPDLLTLEAATERLQAELRDSQDVVQAKVEEAMARAKEELRGDGHSTPEARRFIEGLVEELTAPLREELRSMATSQEANAEEVLAKAKEELRAEAPGTKEAPVATEAFVEGLTAVLREELRLVTNSQEEQQTRMSTEIRGEVQQVVQPLREEMKAKLNVDDFDELLQKALAELSDSISKDVQQSMGVQMQSEVATPLRKELEQKADESDVQRMVEVAVREGLAPLQAQVLELQRLQQEAITQAAVSEALAPIQAQLLELQRLQQEAPTQAALESAVENCVSEAIAPFKEVLRWRPSEERRLRQRLKVLAGEVAAAHDAARAAAQRQEPLPVVAEVAPGAAPWRLVVRAVSMALQLLGGGAVGLIALGLAWDTAPPTRKVGQT